MNRRIDKKAAVFLRRKRTRKAWQKAVGVMAAVVVFCTAYALILPAITLSTQVVCGQEEHAHTEDCYTASDTLVCEILEHTHTEDCYASVEPEETPVQTSAAAVCGGCTVTASWEEGIFPEDVTLMVSRYGENDEKRNLLGAAVSYVVSSNDQTVQNIYPFDIYFTGEDGNKIEPDGTVTVTVSFDEPVAENGENSSQWEVYHIPDTGNALELLSGEDETLTFSGKVERLEEVSIDQSETGEAVHVVNGFSFCSDSFSDFVLTELSDVMLNAAPASLDSFYLWLHVWNSETGQYDKIYENPKWDESVGKFDGSGIEDAMRYVADDGETCCLIPIDYFISCFGEYGYSFDESSTEDCPFQYAPNAGQAGNELTPASYVKVDENWYVQVRDTTGATPNRSNIYYKNYNGAWAIVSIMPGEEAAAMLSDHNVSGEGESSRMAKSVTVETENGITSVFDIAVTKWEFEQQVKGTYYISTIVDGAVKYLHISETENGAVTLSDIPQEITLIEDADEYPGKVYLCLGDVKDEEGNPIAVSRSNNTDGFVSVGDINAPGCWMTLCKVKNITVTFHVKDGKGNTLREDFTIDTEEAARYIFAEGDSSTPGAGNAVYIDLPEIPGYLYAGAKFENHNVYSVATNGYSDENGTFENGTLRFYTTEPPSEGNYYTRDIQNGEVSLYYVQEENNTVNHAGTTINLFDYWVTTKDGADSPGYASGSYDKIGEGINKDRGLKFKVNNGGQSGVLNTSDANIWTGTADPCPDIVKKILENGYPVLSGERNLTDFTGQSLDYLFNPGLALDYKESHTNVKNLLKIDKDGYYYYDCRENYAEFYEESNSFRLYTPLINDGQFFPFNSVAEAAGLTNTYDPVLNHYFGMTMSSHFIQQDGGETKNGKDTVFEFSGDDDVWIFIDDVLVADLGGIHNAASVSIDFASGNITINGEKKYTIKEAFEAALGADRINDLDWREGTFADGTTHTLDFFYLERGNNASNMKLKFNLAEVPVTSIFKVNQYGSPVAGAKFSVYAADADYKYFADKDGEIVSLPNDYKYDDDGNIVDGNGNILVRALYSGITDGGGEMLFVNKERHNMPYSITELSGKFGRYFILRETAVPDGYRLVSDEIKLSISDGENQVLLCHNTYSSGVWAAPTLLVTATDKLYLSNYPDSSTPRSEAKQYYTASGSEGTLFAVVFKRKTGASLTAEASWSPLYGNGKNGYTVLDDERGLISRAIVAAAEQEKLGDRITFSLSASGNMQAELKNLPGDIESYYYMLDENDKEKTQYTVAYYWTEADSLSGATEKNTWRVLADEYAGDSYNGFSRVFGSTIQVPNMINRLFVQKMDNEDNLVNGAQFALYNISEESDDKIYYVADDGTKVFLDEDTDSDNQGKAWLENESSENSGSYKVESATGVITATINNKSYTITPVEIHTTKYEAEENGTASFTKLVTGSYYYVREISAPQGYQINPAQVMVRVTDDAILANAGRAGDGVVVARGPGYVASTLDQFASQGHIDNSLTWILAQMRISGVSASFDVTDKDTYYSEWKYIMGNYEDDPESVTSDRNGAYTTYLKYDTSTEANTIFNYTVNEERYSPELTDQVTRRLYTDVGWSYLEIYQDYAYGNGLTGDAAYQELLDENGQPLEISNLFSRSVYIQVTDRKKGDLEIGKAVVNLNLAEGTVDDTQFTFTVALKNASDENLTGDYHYTVYDKVSGGNDTVAVHIVDDIEVPYTGKIKSGDSIMLKNNQYIRIDDLPEGTVYTITEMCNPAYSTIAKEKVLKNDDYPNGLKTYKFEPGNNSAVTGELYWNDENGVLDNVSEVEFTNTLITGKLVARKEWKGSAGTSVFLTLYRIGGTGVLEKAGSTVELDGSTIDDEPEDVTGMPGVTCRREGWTVTWDNLPIYDAAGGKTTEYQWYVVEDKVQNFLTSYSKEETLKIDGSDIDAGKAEMDTNDGVMYVIVTNTSAYMLPDTGGGGTHKYIIIGIMLMLAACLCGLCINKRSGGRSFKMWMMNFSRLNRNK